MKDHQGENTLWASGNSEYFHFPWSTSRAFSDVVLPANDSANDKHYIKISDYQYAWATQDLSGVYNGKMGISKKNGVWYGNNYGYQSCTTDNAWYTGNPFTKSPSVVGNYGSRYLMLAVLTLQSGSEYTFRPVLTQGEGEAVFSQLYLAIHGYSGTTTSSKGSSAGGMVNTSAVYPEVDWASSWFNYTGMDVNGQKVTHKTNGTLSGSQWRGSDCRYVTLLFRSATGDTKLGAGLEVPVVNTAVDAATTLSAAAVKKKGIDLGTYQYQFITYSPFTYTFRNRGSSTTVKRNGCESVSIPDLAIAELYEGYHISGLKITSGGEALSGSSAVVKNKVYEVSNTYQKSRLSEYLSNGRFYGVLFSDCIIETQYEPNTYSIQYNLDGGSEGNTNPTVATFGSVFMVSAPKRTGYDFAGWIVSGDMTTSSAVYGETRSLGKSVNQGIICSTNASGQIWFSNLTSRNQGTVMLTARWIEKKGEAPILRDRNGIIPSTGSTYGWFHYESVAEQVNSNCFWTEDSDGDLVRLSLYAGDVRFSSLPNVSLSEGILWERTTTSPSGIYINPSVSAYRYGKIEYDFRQADSVNAREGEKIYTLVARDSKGNETRRKIVIYLDMTVPTIVGDGGTEGTRGNNGTTNYTYWEVRKVLGNRIAQTADDSLSGISKVEIYGASNQATPIRTIYSAPWRVTLTAVEWRTEQGIIVKALDHAGNISIKYLFITQQITNPNGSMGSIYQLIPYLPSGG